MTNPSLRIHKITDPAILKQAYAVREEVFVKEQMVAREEEFDEFDATSSHFAVTNLASNVIGTCRWRETNNGIKLERFAVQKNQRGKGVGSLLVEATLRDISEVKGAGNYIYMHAQLDAIPLYEKYGFEKKGELFIECDIAHYTMFRYS